MRLFSFRNRNHVLSYVSLRILFIARLLHVSESIPCHCQGESKCRKGECDGAWCLVGMKSVGDTYMSCGEGDVWIPDICLKRFGEWEQVCACDTPYCNSLGFLAAREREERIRFVNDDSKPNGRRNMGGEKHFAVFNSAGQEVGRNPHEISSERKISATEGTSKGGATSTVIVVLIVVPLVVGSCALLVIALNYYSGMG